MDAMYMQEGKIVYKCEIVTITYTSHCEYETYNACVSILHIYANMTFALRTHCMLDESYHLNCKAISVECNISCILDNAMCISFLKI